ncbi:hypothetical protein [uncultured Jatrophihabitans sp.]|uniref:hypothetical protein n=1 Tax=uncultured Jatrophihabitans sp. TaxID=1610747 RepID=UPI0035C998F3
MVRRGRPAAVLAAVLTICGCTGGAVDGVPSRGPVATANRPSDAGCTTAVRITALRSRVAVTNAQQLGIGPDGTQTNAVLPSVAIVRASVSDPSVGGTLQSALERRVGAQVADAGMRTGDDPAVYTGTVRNTSPNHNRIFVAYRAVTVYTGNFRAACGQSVSTGSFRTFGRPRTAAVPCTGPASVASRRLVANYCR